MIREYNGFTFGSVIIVGDEGDVKFNPDPSELPPWFQEMREKSDPTYIDANLQKTATELAQQILINFQFLKRDLERLEALIQKRWTKKTTEQRKSVLRTAWPEIPTTHRPEFKFIFENFGKGKLALTTEVHNAFLWPDFNSEDLSKENILLLLLNSCGRKLEEIGAYDS
jgi:hypothetical protein